MAKDQHQQVKVGPTQPLFPGGWVSALLRALGDVSPAATKRYHIPARSRTFDRLKSGPKPVKGSTYGQWHDLLVRIVGDLFPHVGSINGFAEKYVSEYFHLWTTSAAHAPAWEKAMGNAVSAQPVLFRALIRDLLLRLCYLQSCELHLTGCASAAQLPCPSFNDFYGLFVERKKQIEGLSQDALAVKLEVYVRIIGRWKSGKSTPSLAQLRRLAPDLDEWLIAGVLFLDHLLRRLKLRDTSISNEMLPIGSAFIYAHGVALKKFRGELPRGAEAGKRRLRHCQFEEYARYADHLLLHPGFESLGGTMPDALWRAHLATLQFARPVDLARDYLRLATPRTDRALIRFLSKQT